MSDAPRTPPTGSEGEGPAEDGVPIQDGNAGKSHGDSMAPPEEPCECWCMHCRRTFMSDRMWFQRVIGDKRGFDGFWMCPTPNCSGAGFTFDIFPTDPDHPANSGWHSFEDDEEGEFIEEEEDEEWDPDESVYREMDELMGDEEEDDMEGEEWKYGLQPGEALPESPAQAEARLRWEEEQKKYDQPDERPRVVDWSDREYPEGGKFNEDDIPF